MTTVFDIFGPTICVALASALPTMFLSSFCASKTAFARSQSLAGWKSLEGILTGTPAPLYRMHFLPLSRIKLPLHAPSVSVTDTH